jgi:hypothetical protein
MGRNFVVGLLGKLEGAILDFNLGNPIEPREATPEIESFPQPTQTDAHARSREFTGKWLMKWLIDWRRGGDAECGLCRDVAVGTG